MAETAADRLRLIIGDEGLEQLAAARVAVIGLGGVGSSCAEALVRGGVGRLVLLDRDVVAPSNLNRQALAFTSTIGRPKAEVMRAMALDINPAVDVTAVTALKLRLAQWCQERGVPELSAMGGANKLDPCRLRFAAIEDTVNCPLARVMRKECRRRGIRGLRVLFSDEEPVRMERISDEQWLREGSLLGTMSYLPPIMGQMLASRLGWA